MTKKGRERAHGDISVGGRCACLFIRITKVKDGFFFARHFLVRVQTYFSLPSLRPDACKSCFPFVSQCYNTDSVEKNRSLSIQFAAFEVNVGTYDQLLCANFLYADLSRGHSGVWNITGGGGHSFIFVAFTTRSRPQSLQYTTACVSNFISVLCLSIHLIS